MDKSDLEKFIKQVDDFENLNLSYKTDLIVYYLQNKLKLYPIKKADIEKAFSILRISGLSSLSSYLSINSKKSKRQKFIKSDSGILLTRTFENELKEKINNVIKVEPSNDLFPLSLLNNTRGYIESVGKQSVIAYDYGAFDASLVMIRKLVEILIIELFEKKGIENEIKNPNGDYFYLSDLITKLLSNHSIKWNLSRNLRNGVPKIKKYGDLSAHNRRFVARKSDIDNIKDEIRIVIEELLILNEFN